MNKLAMMMIEPFDPRELGPKPWGQELLIAETPYYIGKVLIMHAGHRGGLQYHERKDETFHLFSGLAIIRSDDGHGGLVSTTMTPGMSFRIPPRAAHQVEAINHCVFFEVSTPVFDDRVNVGAAYGQGERGEAR